METIKTIIETFDGSDFGEREIKMKKVTVNELEKIVIDMPFEKVLDFAGEYRDEEFCNWFAIQKINWLDNDVILIGGYHQNTRLFDMREMEDKDLINFIYDYFICEELNNTVFVITE
jgi:hypothetical protein